MLYDKRSATFYRDRASLSTVNDAFGATLNYRQTA